MFTKKILMEKTRKKKIGKQILTPILHKMFKKSR